MSQYLFEAGLIFMDIVLFFCVMLSSVSWEFFSLPIIVVFSFVHKLFIVALILIIAKIVMLVRGLSNQNKYPPWAL